MTKSPPTISKTHFMTLSMKAQWTTWKTSGPSKLKSLSGCKSLPRLLIPQTNIFIGGTQTERWIFATTQSIGMLTKVEETRLPLSMIALTQVFKSNLLIEKFKRMSPKWLPFLSKSLKLRRAIQSLFICPWCHQLLGPCWLVQESVLFTQLCSVDSLPKNLQTELMIVNLSYSLLVPQA